MRVLKKLDVAVGEPGEIKLSAMDADDMWNLYNMISTGDIVRAFTSRKVDKHASSGKASTGQERVNMFLNVIVTHTEWDGVTNQLRVSGLVPDTQGGKAADYIRHGQHHTLQIDISDDVVLKKECWTSYDVDRYNDATSTYKDCTTAACVLQLGLAHTCLITRTMCPTLAKVEKVIPKKTSATATMGYDVAVKKFYTQVAETFSAVPTTITCFILAGPAFVAQDFLQFLQNNYAERYAWLFPIIRITHASTGHKHALLEALGTGQLKDVIKSSNLESEQTLLGQFLSLLGTDEGRVFYGEKDVQACVDQKYAITELMILDTLFKSTNAQERKRFVDLVDTVRKRGGKVTIFSSLNPTSEQLKQLTGIACILQYAAQDLHGEVQEEEMQQYITAAMQCCHEYQFFDSNSNVNYDFLADGLDMFIPTLTVATNTTTAKRPRDEVNNNNKIKKDKADKADKADKTDKTDKTDKKQQSNSNPEDKSGSKNSKKDKKDKKENKKEKSSAPKQLGEDDLSGPF